MILAQESWFFGSNPNNRYRPRALTSGRHGLSLSLCVPSVLEVAVVGPPDLYRVGFKSVGPLAAMTMAWIRSENQLPRLLPVCFVANTNR